MNNKKLLLGIGIVLIVVGLLKPNISNILPKPSNPSISVVTVEAPKDSEILELAINISKILKDNNATNEDCLRLSNLYSDLATLISLDEANEIIKNTEEIRQANKIAGLMLRMNLNDKYPNLANSMNNLVVKSIGDDNIILTKELRIKAVNAFNALAWACNEGTK